jgi:TRAP-type uncharacterized transport system fused permease subunit
MLLIDFTIVGVIVNVATALMGMYSLAGGLTGFVQDHCKWYERLLLIAGGLGMIDPGLYTDIFGFTVLAVVIFLQKRRTSTQKTA